jgi:Tfp pilus assembly protein PilN
MILVTNFVSPAGRLAPYLAGIFWSIALAAAVCSVLLLLAGYQLRNERVELDQRLARFAAQEIRTPADMLPRERLMALRQQVQVLNSLTGAVGQPLSTLLVRLEKLTPDGVWLVNLQHRPREGEIKLLVEAERAELLTAFMERLEHSKMFTQVLLTRQAQRADGSHRTIQFEIRLREHS